MMTMRLNAPPAQWGDEKRLLQRLDLKCLCLHVVVDVPSEFTAYKQRAGCSVWAHGHFNLCEKEREVWYVMLVAQLPSYAGTKWYVMLVAKAGLPCKHPQKHAAAFRLSTTISILQALKNSQRHGDARTQIGMPEHSACSGHHCRPAWLQKYPSGVL